MKNAYNKFSMYINKYKKTLYIIFVFKIYKKKVSKKQNSFVFSLKIAIRKENKLDIVQLKMIKLV